MVVILQQQALFIGKTKVIVYGKKVTVYNRDKQWVNTCFAVSGSSLVKGRPGL